MNEELQMSRTETNNEPGKVEPEALPFVAPCRQLALTDPFKWLELGWRDFRQTPRTSLLYGGFLVLISYLVSYLTWKLGGIFLILSLLSGFVFIAPVLAIGLYSISCQLQQGLRPRIGYCLLEGRRHLGNEMIYSMILLVIFLVWARAASMVHAFFPLESDVHLSNLIVFLGVGSAVGSIFAALVFSASAFSLPMMLDRKVDTVTAVITSVNAVLRNKGPMAVWAGIIIASLAISFATAFLGLAILMPVIGYAAWHGYRDTIQADAWPETVKLPAGLEDR
jgi:uncharacterized membrane protein